MALHPSIHSNLTRQRDLELRRRLARPRRGAARREHKAGRWHFLTRSFVVGLVAAACVAGIAASSSSAAGPIFTDWSAPVNLGPVVNSGRE